MEAKHANFRALLPIAVFLVLYLGTGIWYEYISPVEGQPGFYIMSVVVAFILALMVAMLQNRSLNFDEKIRICAKGIGNENITIMLFIFLIAGAFGGIAKQAGGAKSTVPIAASVSESGGISLPLCVATVVGGGMFGDNLSFISDTTIAATRSQGVEMKDKFRANFRIAFPAALVTLIILTAVALRSKSVNIGHFDFNFIQAIPYFVVLAMALLGLNVFIVLIAGILLFAIAGTVTGTLTYVSAFTSMGEGTSGMFETMIVTILVASISALIRENGGFEAILQFIEKHFSGKRGGKAGIAALTALMDVSTANNTVAIVVAGPIAKEISDKFKVEPELSASLLDSASCIMQGIIPYGAQLLVASSLCAATNVSIIPYLFYPFALAAFLIISILRTKESSNAAAGLKTEARTKTAAKTA